MAKTIPEELEAAGFHVHVDEMTVTVQAVLYVNDGDGYLAGDVRYPEKRVLEAMIFATRDKDRALVFTDDGKFSEATLMSEDRDGRAVWFVKKVTQFRKWLKGDREIEGRIAEWPTSSPS